jgi:hypothetical protein
VNDANLSSSTLAKRNKPVHHPEFETATILHGVKTILTGDHADVFGQCYMNSYNQANRGNQYDGAPILTTMTEDTQWIVEFTRDRRSLTTPITKPALTKPTKPAPTKPAPTKPAPTKPSAPKPTPTPSPGSMVFFLGKFPFGPECTLCGNDDDARLLQQQQGEGEPEEVEERALAAATHADLETRLFSCLKYSGLPNFLHLAKVEVHHLLGSSSNSGNVVVVDPLTRTDTSSSSSSSTKQVDLAGPTIPKTTPPPPPAAVSHHNMNKIKVQFRSATILHGIHETLTGDDADLFHECYLTSYNEAASSHGEDMIEPVVDESDSIQQWVIESGEGDDTNRTAHRHRSLSTPTIRGQVSASYQPPYAPPKTSKNHQFIFYLGKFQFGPECTLCGNDRLLSSSSKQRHNKNRELVHAVFERSLYNCLLDSGSTVFDPLVKLEVHHLSPTPMPAAALVMSMA